LRCIIVSISIGNDIMDKWNSFSLNNFFCVMSIANVYVVILIYALILSILTIDKDVIYHVIYWEILVRDHSNYEILRFKIN